MSQQTKHAIVIGAGIGGLSAALRLAHAGLRVTVLDRLSAPGGKMRCLPTVAGPVDAGPTVLTMKPVFDALFSDTGSALENHVTLERETLLARHFWRGGPVLDLMTDPAHSADNIHAAFGAEAARDFRAFDARAKALFDGFEGPVMQAEAPSNLGIARALMKTPTLIRAMAPHKSLAGMLHSAFGEPRLAQLFGRYATYVGGIPHKSPALLALIWHAEAQGVWHVKGGMHKLAQAIAQRAAQLGATFEYNSHVTRIEIQDGKPCAVHTEAGRITADLIVYNGDPRAIHTGQLGQNAAAAVPEEGVKHRSLSAAVHSFAAQPAGPELAAHNVFFGDDPMGEFGPLAQGQMPHDPTLYICAQDRFGGAQPTGAERFEIIMNAPPAPDGTPLTTQEIAQCQTRTFNRLADFGLRFSPTPGPETLCLPQNFAALFPASNGSLYGRSPHGMMAAFQRPTVRSRIRGIYLVGGGVHPGAGVPMVTLCAQHAAEAILQDLTLTSTSRQADTHGGTSTGSATMGSGQSPSSVS